MLISPHKRAPARRSCRKTAAVHDGRRIPFRHGCILSDDVASVSATTRFEEALMATTVDSEQVKAAVRETVRPNCNRGTVCGLLQQHRMLRPMLTGPPRSHSATPMGTSCGAPKAPIWASAAAIRTRSPHQVGRARARSRDRGGIRRLSRGTPVGETGRVIGVDMTPEMIAKARGTSRRPTYGTSSSGSARSNIFQSPTRPSTRSCRTA